MALDLLLPIRLTAKESAMKKEGIGKLVIPTWGCPSEIVD